jgi:hypothetical protein
MLFRDSAKIDNQCIFVRLGLASGLDPVVGER